MLYVLLDHIQPVIDSSMLPLVVIHQKLREFYEPIDQHVNAALGLNLIPSGSPATAPTRALFLFCVCSFGTATPNRKSVSQKTALRLHSGL